MLLRNSFSVISLLVILSVNQTHGQCSRDIDCKGDRICDNGQCHSPGTNTGASECPADECWCVNAGGYSCGDTLTDKCNPDECYNREECNRDAGYRCDNLDRLGELLVHAKVEGNYVYFQLPWTSGALSCQSIDPDDGEVYSFDAYEGPATYHDTYAQCGGWDRSAPNSSRWTVQLILNGVTYTTNELTARANGPIADPIPPPDPDYLTSCLGIQSFRYQSLQSAWDACLNDSECKGVRDGSCDDDNWRLCYGESRKSDDSCFYDRNY